MHKREQGGTNFVPACFDFKCHCCPGCSRRRRSPNRGGRSCCDASCAAYLAEGDAYPVLRFTVPHSATAQARGFVQKEGVFVLIPFAARRVPSGCPGRPVLPQPDEHALRMSITFHFVDTWTVGVDSARVMVEAVVAVEHMMC